jgi:hypothetical protein
VRRAAEIAHAVGAKLFVDAVHYAPHGLIDVQEWIAIFLPVPPTNFTARTLGFFTDDATSSKRWISEADPVTEFSARTGRDWDAKS